MSNEYIRKSDAVDAVPKERIVEYMNEFDAGYNSCRNDILRSIESLTPADVAPVVHGRWLKEDRGHVEYDAVCSACGFDWMWSDRGYFKFCPNCGAEMDAKGEERGLSSMADEYIRKRDAIKAACRGFCHPGVLCPDELPCREQTKYLRELPPADVVPVRHGTWLPIVSYNNTYKCSECGRLLVDITDGLKMVAKNYPYCHCGAKMDKE